MKNMSADNLTNIRFPVHVKLECFILTKYFCKKFAYKWPIPNLQNWTTSSNTLAYHASVRNVLNPASDAKGTVG